MESRATTQAGQQKTRQFVRVAHLVSFLRNLLSLNKPCGSGYVLSHSSRSNSEMLTSSQPAAELRPTPYLSRIAGLPPGYRMGGRIGVLKTWPCAMALTASENNYPHMGNGSH